MVEDFDDELTVNHMRRQHGDAAVEVVLEVIAVEEALAVTADMIARRGGVSIMLAQRGTVRRVREASAQVRLC